MVEHSSKWISIRYICHEGHQSGYPAFAELGCDLPPRTLAEGATRYAAGHN